MGADMENMEELEMTLWDYIDGRCNAAEQAHIEQLIAANTVWQQKYKELVAFNKSIAQHTDLEQPSMRFTKNIMDAVATTKIAPATTKYINLGIIRVIVAFFLVVIGGALAFIAASINWNGDSGPAKSFLPHNFHLNQLSTPAFINVTIAISVMLGLLLADRLVRSRRAHS